MRPLSLQAVHVFVSGMKILRTSQEMQAWALAQRAEIRRIGLVPTMGYLHEGHRSLMRRARQDCDAMVVSIFVNPTQFGPNEDLSRYPRDFERDEAMCRAERADVIFYPTAAGMYAGDHSVFVVEEQLSEGLCGASRPTHFRGVCTVVAKLFNLVLPQLAVFGEKDGQQLRVIRRMVRDLNFPVHIVAVPTVREPDGLAMSSRNAYLSPVERSEAVCLRRALDEAERMAAAGERDAVRLCERMREIIKKSALARVDYVEIRDDETLLPVAILQKPALAALAVFIGKTRLIDNTRLPA